MRKTELSSLINYPATEAFRYATDPSHLAEWFIDGTQALMVSEGQFVKGSSFTVRRAGEDRPRRDIVYHVIGFENHRSFSVKTAGKLLTYTSRLTFEAQNGNTQITDSLEMENPPGLLNLVGGWILRRVRQTHQERLVRLRELIEHQRIEGESTNT